MPLSLVEARELLLSKMGKTRNNAEFLGSMPTPTFQLPTASRGRLSAADVSAMARGRGARDVEH
jgi:hypothetical protein